MKFKYATCVRYNIGQKAAFEKAAKTYYKGTKAAKKALKKALEDKDNKKEIGENTKAVKDNADIKAAVEKVECKTATGATDKKTCTSIISCKATMKTCRKGKGKCTKKRHH